MTRLPIWLLFVLPAACVSKTEVVNDGVGSWSGTATLQSSSTCGGAGGPACPSSLPTTFKVANVNGNAVITDDNNDTFTAEVQGTSLSYTTTESGVLTGGCTTSIAEDDTIDTDTKLVTAVATLTPPCDGTTQGSCSCTYAGVFSQTVD